MGIMSRSQVGVSHEVRLPRSSTFQTLAPDLDDSQRLPSISEPFKILSVRSPAEEVCSAPKALDDPQRLPSISECFKSPFIPSPAEELSSAPKALERSPPRSIILADYSAYVPRNRVIPGSLPPSASAPILHGSDSKLRMPINRKQSDEQKSEKASKDIAQLEANNLDSESVAKPLLLFPPARALPKPALPRSMTILNFGDVADVLDLIQVKDYMPALYWAGRFQSRFDHWRTEAMYVELDPHHRVSESLGMLNIDEDDKVACHIFLELRDLCMNSQAADSLWVSTERSIVSLNKTNDGL
jgi:hypothetical protein